MWILTTQPPSQKKIEMASRRFVNLWLRRCTCNSDVTAGAFLFGFQLEIVPKVISKIIPILSISHDGSMELALRDGTTELKLCNGTTKLNLCDGTTELNLCDGPIT